MHLRSEISQRSEYERSDPQVNAQNYFSEYMAVLGPPTKYPDVLASTISAFLLVEAD